MTQPNYTYGTSNNTRGVIASGYQGSGTAANQLDYITCATAGNASDFGDQLLIELVVWELLVMELVVSLVADIVLVKTVTLTPLIM